MSMNLYLQATLKAVTKLGDKELKEECNLYQTPTDVTYKVLENTESDKIFQAYSEWILSRSGDEVVKIYDPEDFFQRDEPIGEKIVNYGKVHLEEVKAWLEDHKEWEIEWYYM